MLAVPVYDAAVGDAAAIQERWNREALEQAWAELGSIPATDCPPGFEALSIDGWCPAALAEPARQATVLRVLDQLSTVLGPKALLLWFTGSSGHLDGSRPIDVIDELPDDVVAAAAYQASLSWP